MPTTGFRFFNVYGPRQDPLSPYSGVISIFAKRILAGQPVTIFGDGQQIRDFIYVSDVIAFLVAGMQHASTTAPVYNACTGIRTNIVQLAFSLASVQGVTAEITEEAPRAGDIRVSLGDPSQAQNKLQTRAVIDLWSGLRATLAYMKKEELEAA